MSPLDKPNQSTVNKLLLQLKTGNPYITDVIDGWIAIPAKGQTQTASQDTWQSPNHNEHVFVCFNALDKKQKRAIIRNLRQWSDTYLRFADLHDSIARYLKQLRDFNSKTYTVQFENFLEVNDQSVFAAGCETLKESRVYYTSTIIKGTRINYKIDIIDEVGDEVRAKLNSVVERYAKIAKAKTVESMKQKLQFKNKELKNKYKEREDFIQKIKIFDV